MGEGLTGPCVDCRCVLNQLPRNLQQNMECATHPAHSLICVQGQPIDRVLVLCKGMARLVRSRKSLGRQLELFQAQAGAILGYQELIEGSACWTSSVEAVQQCTVIAVDADAFMSALVCNFNAACTLLQQNLRQRLACQRALMSLRNAQAPSHAHANGNEGVANVFRRLSSFR